MQSLQTWNKQQHPRSQNLKPRTNNFVKGVKVTSNDESDEEDPEWVDFDPKKDKTAFFGREIPDEATLRT